MPTTTFLFVDQVGSTEQLRALGDVVAGPLRAALMAGLVESASGHGGRVVDVTGDGLFAAFTSSIDALEAAADMQSAVTLANQTRPHAHQVAVRVGVHTGEPLVDESGSYFGLAVVVARRLCDLAAGGQILVSNIVRALAEPRQAFRFATYGPCDLKGVSETVEVSEVAWAPEPLRLPTTPQPGAGAPPTASVSPASIEQLDRVWSAVIDGSRRAAILSGPPGATLPLVARQEDVARQAGAVVLAVDQTEDGTPLDRWLGLARTCITSVSPATARMQLGAHLDELAIALPEMADRFGTLVALPETTDESLVAAIGASLAAVCGLAPVVVNVTEVGQLTAVELSLIEHLLEPSRPGRLLLMLTSAPTDARPTTRLASLLHHNVLVLSVGSTHPPTEDPDLSGDGTTRYVGQSAPLALLVLPEGTRFAIDPAGTIIGRNADCGLRIDDTDVSRYHAELRAVGPNWVIRDRDSTNGTKVNGQPVREQILLDGDEVVIGGAALTFRVG